MTRFDRMEEFGTADGRGPVRCAIVAHGRGACQAIEDAVVIARSLEQVVQTNAKDGVPSALRRYEGLRGERTAWIVRRSRALGRIGQIENPLLCRLRDAVLKATPTRTQLRQLDQVLPYEERLG